MKKENLLQKNTFCGWYLIISSLISFLTLSPWWKIVKYKENDTEIIMTPAEYLSYSNANKAYVTSLILFYVLLWGLFLIGIFFLFLNNYKKRSAGFAMATIIIDIVLVYLSFGFFFDSNGLNIPSIILFLAGIVITGIYFVQAFSDFVTHRMEVKAKKKIDKMK